MHQQFAGSDKYQPVTLWEVANLYIADRPEMSKGYRTRINRVCKGAERSLGGQLFAAMLNLNLLEDWLADEERRGIKALTLAIFRNVFVSLWADAWRRGFTDTQPPLKSLIETDGLRKIGHGNGPAPSATLQSPPKAMGSSTLWPAWSGPETALRKIFREQYYPRKLRAKSWNGVRLHENTLNNFAKFLGREPLLGDLDDDLVSSFMGWMTSRGRSPATVNNNRNRLLALWSFAARKQLVKAWPDVEPEPEPKRIPRGWQRHELERLFSALLAVRGKVCGAPASNWWLALHYVIWDSGERIGAVLALRWEWIDFGALILNVPAEVRKGKREDRRYPLNPGTAELLRSIRSPERELVFPWRGTLTTLYSAYDKILAGAGLPTGRQFKFHCLRKSVASHGKAAGLDPVGLMGHADARVTAKYLDPAIVGQPPTASTLFRPTSPNGGGKEGGAE